MDFVLKKRFNLSENLRLYINIELFIIFIFFGFPFWEILQNPLQASQIKRNTLLPNHFQTKVNFGSCPKHVTQEFVSVVVKSLIDGKSLWEIKAEISRKKWMSQYFLQDYKVQIFPHSSLIHIETHCPKALLKTKIYKEQNGGFYQSILSSSGEFFPPTFEVALRTEGLLSHDLPHLEISLKQLSLDPLLPRKIVALMEDPYPSDRQWSISEFILKEDGLMSLVISIKEKDSLFVYLGQDLWLEKYQKLHQVLEVVLSQGRPLLYVDMNRLEKVVVKFKPGS